MTFEVMPGTFTITETAVAGYDTAIECFNRGDKEEGSGPVFTAGGTEITIDAAPGGDLTCTFRNTDVTMAELTVRKFVEPSAGSCCEIGGQRFDFSVTGAGLSDNFSLGHFDSQRFDVAPGSYTVAELGVPSNFTTGIECFHDDSRVPVADVLISGTAATLTLAGGDDIDCVFTNTDLAKAIILVDKSVRPSEIDPTDFTFTMTGPNGFMSQFVLDADELSSFVQASKVFEDLEPGSYSISEQAVAGYSTSIECFDTASSNAGDFEE